MTFLLKFYFSLLFILIVNYTSAQNSEFNILKVSDTFSFINYNANFIQYNNPDLIRSIYNKWINAGKEKLTIAHFGDSHVQIDQFVSSVRNILQDQKGNAGRGMIFPYSIAKTYSQSDYSSSFTGKWSSANSIQLTPKIPLGISGFVATTFDTSASFNIYFTSKLDSTSKNIILYTKNQQSGYRLKIITANNSVELLLDTCNNTFGVEMKFISDTIEFKLFKDSCNANEFSLYGISIENKLPGILYHNLGVGGACYSALINQKYFEDQIKIINPDLIILDWGTNDIIYNNSIGLDLKETILNTIKKVRISSPNSEILLTTVQDMNYKGKNISVSERFSDIIRNIAFENECLLYDWFNVTGGRFKMKKWENYGLSRVDNIHLTSKGYQLKAKLFSEALFNSFNFYKTNSSPLIVAPSFRSVNDLY